MSTPIIFSFDDNYTIPAGVCISSLLKHSTELKLVDIYILHSSNRLCLENKNRIKVLEKTFSNCSISFIDIEDSFSNEYETRGVSIETYFRLLIPNLFQNYDKVWYFDTDMIFTRNICELLEIKIDDHSLAGVLQHDISYNKKDYKYCKKMNLNPQKYINAGVLLFNNKKINSSATYKQTILSFKGSKFKFQDQDILNIIFKDDIYFLQPTYNYSTSTIQQGICIKDPHIIHFILKKPWNQPKVFGDIWWQYYKESIFYNEQFYFSYLKNNSIDLDRHITIGKVNKKIGIYKILDWIR